jgi:hypothetical protein
MHHVARPGSSAGGFGHRGQHDGMCDVQPVVDNHVELSLATTAVATSSEAFVTLGSVASSTELESPRRTMSAVAAMAAGSDYASASSSAGDVGQGGLPLLLGWRPSCC